MKRLTLRAHHINCLFFYQGKGYSESFTQQMDCVMQSLLEDGDQIITLVLGPDLLCHQCPHLREGVCISGDKIAQLDTRTLKIYGLQTGRDYSFNQIKEGIYRCYDEQAFTYICQDCEWFRQGVCAKEKIQEQQKKWL
ncbi:MAG: DUF1284 domain-containing protein [Cellulosilyticaceae bacterium]